MLDTIRTILIRELRAVVREVEAYPDDALLWEPIEGAPNTGGTLALHIAGNIQHYIGAVVGASGYLRDRDAEFEDRDVPRERIVAELKAAAEAVDRSLVTLTPDRLDAPYPERVGGHTVRTLDFLVHLIAHLAYHLGQLDYHRRTVTGDRAGVGAISVRELPSPPAVPGTA